MAPLLATPTEWPPGPGSAAGQHSAHPEWLPEASVLWAPFPVTFFLFNYFFGNKEKSLFAQNRRYFLCSPQCSKRFVASGLKAKPNSFLVQMPCEVGSSWGLNLSFPSRGEQFLLYWGLGRQDGLALQRVLRPGRDGSNTQIIQIRDPRESDGGPVQNMARSFPSSR